MRAVMLLLVGGFLPGCGDDSGVEPPDAAMDARVLEGGQDGGEPDAGADAAADASADGSAGVEDCTNATDDDGDSDVDCADGDCVLDAACAYSCGAFTTAPEGWTLAPGLRAVEIADATDGLDEPVGLAFAGRAFGGLLYVTDQAARTVFAIDVETGDTTPFAAAPAFPSSPAILTAIAWDAAGAFDGNLYVTDSVTDGDQDAVVYRLTSGGVVTTFAEAPGPGLDSIYAMAFAPPGVTPAGLYVAGDTDGSGVDWGVFDRDGGGAPFSEVAGIEGIAFDATGRYGTGAVAARPLGGGYDGDGSITALDEAGVARTPIATGLGGVHANVVAPPGLFEGEMVAASWSTNTIFRVSPAGTVTMLVSGLALTNYNANILAVSPDGRVLMVADRLASRVVCVEES
jgi:hypothetical protein